MSPSLKVLLVQPRTPDSYWSFSTAIGYTGTRAVMPPLSLLTVAALMPQDWQFRLVDENIQELSDDHIRRADVVFISGMIIHRTGIQQVVERCHRLNKAVVVGGPFVTSLPEAPELKLATSLVLGELEDPEFLAALTADFQSAKLKPRYQAPSQPSLANAPVPRFDLLEVAAYNSMAIQMSRGCPQRCEFCDIIVMYGRKPRYKTAKQVLAELEALYQTGFRGNVFVVDDNFIGNWKLVEALLPPLQAWQAKRGYPFGLYTEADMRLAKMPKLMDNMVAAGFFAVFMGIESPSTEALKEVAKHQNTGINLVDSVWEIRRHGLMVYGGFIVGFDADTVTSFDAMIEFVQDAAIDFAMVGTLIALAGTPLLERLTREGRITEGDADGDQFKLSNVIPLQMSQLDLVRGYRRVLETLYRPENYFDRARRAIQGWRPGPARKTNGRELGAVPRSFLKQGVWAPYRREYWKFMLWVKLNRPDALARAFAMAISYAHFHYYTNAVVVPRLRRAEEELLRWELERDEAQVHGLYAVT